MKRRQAMEAIRASKADEETELWLRRMRDEAYVEYKSWTLPRIALTSGEPAGVGPELCLALAAGPLPCELICLGDRALLAERAQRLKLAVELYPYDPAVAPAAHVPGMLAVAHEALAVPSIPGRPDLRNARYVLKLLDRAIDGALTGEFSALVTAPVQKSLINDAGIAFSGHTEYLATARRRRLAGDAAHQRGAAGGARHHAPAAAGGE